MKSISIIIPAHNEEKNIPLIYDELQKIFKTLQDKYIFDIIFVNDGSTDGTIGEIEKLAETDQNVKYIDFSRNFGKEIATTAALNNCHSDACVMLDADLQHPVELIPEFIKKWEEGSEMVVGVRNKNRSTGLMKKIGSAVFYKIINKIYVIIFLFCCVIKLITFYQIKENCIFITKITFTFIFFF
jgi:dolichol-phosphate mannosyltransferase